MHAGLDGDDLTIGDLQIVAARHILPEVKVCPKGRGRKCSKLRLCYRAGGHFILFMVEDYWYLVFVAHSFGC